MAKTTKKSAGKKSKKSSTVRKSTKAAKSARRAKTTKTTKSAKTARKAIKKRPAVKKAASKKTGKKTATAAARTAPKTAKKARRPAAKPAARTRPATKPVETAVRKPVEAVPTGTRPRKNQSGISHKDLIKYRELLLEKRREIVGDMSAMEREALRATGTTNLSNLPLHMADMGTDNYEQEFTLGLVEKDRQLLREINNALAKIQDGTYGLCEGTGKPISKARLEAQPWARHSIEYAREMERNPYRR